MLNSKNPQNFYVLTRGLANDNGKIRLFIRLFVIFFCCFFQKGAEKLQKELKNYATSLKATAAASKLYYEAVRDVYEPDWPGVEHVKAMTQVQNPDATGTL